MKTILIILGIISLLFTFMFWCMCKVGGGDNDET